MKNQIKTIFLVSLIFFLVIAMVWKLITTMAFRNENKPQNRLVLNVNDHDYASSSTASLLFFNNQYSIGMQGGIEIITHGERLATNGDLRVLNEEGNWGQYSVENSRSLNEEQRRMRTTRKLEDGGMGYELVIDLLENSFRLTVNLDEPLSRQMAGKVFFNLHFLPSAYEGETIIMDRQRKFLCPAESGSIISEDGRPVPFAEGGEMILASGNPQKKITIRQEKGTMKMFDDRALGQGKWYRLSSEIEPGSKEKALVWEVDINQIKGWVRPPVILHSQVGYHPDQKKEALIELSRNERHLDKVSLFRINNTGEKESAYSAKPVYRGKFLRYHYYAFDFTGIKEEGLYTLSYQDVRTSVFRITGEVYEEKVWQPTLGTFIPVQMDHMEIHDRDRIWHGLSHLDDALQAPPGKDHFDSYRMDDTTWTSYSPYEHIPGLNEGGWYDAGDYDLRTISHINTIYWLGLAYDSFKQDWDQTTIDMQHRKVILKRPDGIPDLVQQVRHGAVFLLNMYENIGHAIPGIISPTIEQYVHLGDGSLMTDNLIYDPMLDSAERTGLSSGIRDDRLAFTNRSSALNYGMAKTLALSSKVLFEYDPVLAERCLQAAGKIWDYEQQNDPVIFDGGQTYSELLPAEKIDAAAELLIATGDEKYEKALNDLIPVIEVEFQRTIASVARVNDLMPPEFQVQYRTMAGNYIQSLGQHIGSNPFGVPWSPSIWGVGWDLQEYAAHLFYLYRAFPDLVDPELIFRVVNFVLGTHPGSNVSFVSEVGQHSMTIAYGINRADHTCIPGGVVSGTALIKPDFPELKEEWPFLWQQSEYVIDGAATWVFCVMAVNNMLN